MLEHWADEGLPAWDVKVGDRVRQGEDPVGVIGEAQPVGSLGTVTWVQDQAERQGIRPEVLVRWDGVTYASREDGSMTSWIEPAPDEHGLSHGLDS